MWREPGPNMTAAITIAGLSTLIQPTMAVSMLRLSTTCLFMSLLLGLGSASSGAGDTKTLPCALVEDVASKAQSRHRAYVFSMNEVNDDSQSALDEIEYAV